MNILITGAFKIKSGEISKLESFGNKVFLHGDEKSPVNNPARYDAVVCNALFLYNSIEAFTNLKIIQLTSAGLDRVPLDYIKSHRIALYNAKDVYSVPMAEYAIGGILQIYKNFPFYYSNQKTFKWEKERNSPELSGKTAVILGCGDVGSEIAKRLKAFNCCVIGLNRTARNIPCFDKILPLSELLSASEKADIFICSVALTPETQGILNENFFKTLNAKAVFVNVARGKIVNEKALIDWLKKGSHAVLDVFETEPLPPSSPLWKMKNVIITPHISFIGDGNRARLWNLIYGRFGFE